MKTLEVTILEPKALGMLDEMEREKLIKTTRVPQVTSEKKPLPFGALKKSRKKDRVFGSMPGLVVHISDDFDEPLEDFAEYM